MFRNRGDAKDIITKHRASQQDHQRDMLDEEETGAEEAILSSTGGTATSSAVSSKLSTGHSDPSQRWLLALHDPLAGLYTFSSCICFADLFNDGDVKLAIADLGNNLKNVKLNIYKGTVMQTQLALIDLPCAIVSFYMDSGDAGHTPALAVAAGNFLYIYKKLKPFYKFQLPPLGLNQAEVDSWNQVKEQAIDVQTLADILRSVSKQPGDVPLTSRSTKFLSLTDRSQMEQFVEQQKDQPLKRQTVITCVTTLKRSVSDEDAVSCLVIGTENRDILFIEPDAFTILATVSRLLCRLLSSLGENGFLTHEQWLRQQERGSERSSSERVGSSHAESTGSRPIPEVKQRRAESVLGWVTAWEHSVSYTFDSFYPISSSRGHSYDDSF